MWRSSAKQRSVSLATLSSPSHSACIAASTERGPPLTASRGARPGPSRHRPENRRCRRRPWVATSPRVPENDEQSPLFMIDRSRCTRRGQIRAYHDAAVFWQFLPAWCLLLVRRRCLLPSTHTSGSSPGRSVSLRTRGIQLLSSPAAVYVAVGEG